MAEQCKLFVGNLPADTTQEELGIIFETYGHVLDVHLMPGKAVSGQSCAFVIYGTADEAECAIRSLDGVYSVRGTGDAPIRVSWSRQGGAGPPPPRAAEPSWHPDWRSGKPGGKGAPANRRTPPVAPAGPRAQASPYGAAPRQKGASKGSYGSYGPARKGASSLPPAPPAPARPPQQTKLFVGNLPMDITEDAMAHVFGTYGTVTDIHVMPPKSKSGQTCAFVSYATQEEAETAILTLHEKYEIRDGEGRIVVRYADFQGPKGPKEANERMHNTMTPRAQAASSHSQRPAPARAPTKPAPRTSVPANNKRLWVGSLPADVTEDMLRIVFSDYGTVENVHVMGGKSKSGQSCAFVEYANPSEAETAINSLHEVYEIEPGAGPILVRYANSGGPRA